MRYLFLSAAICLAALATATAVSYAQGDARGAAAATAELDAGVVNLDPLPPSVQPHVDPVADPSGAWSEITAARKTGGLQLAVGLAIAVIAGAIRLRLQPTPGQPEPDPESWHARTLALLGAAVALGWGFADRAAGATSWIGLATIAVGAAALVWRAVNPPRGAKHATGAAA